MSTLLSKLMKFLAVAAAALTVTAGSAIAANYSLDDGLPGTEPQFPGDLTKSVFVGAGAFTDLFFFDVDKIGGGSTSVASPIYVSFAPTNAPTVLNLGSTTVSLFSQVGTLLASQTGTGASSFTFNTTLPSLAPLAGNPDAYFWVQVAGTATGDVGGVYSVSISPVPEPHEWAMLLAGLGMLGVAARRRRSLSA